MIDLEITTAHEGGDDDGFIGSLYRHGNTLYAAGGTYYHPTLLVSTDGGAAFTRWKPPDTPGLRDVCVVGKQVWVAGEYGMVATTSTGKRWKTIEVPTGAICLYQIKLDPSGAMWILGDNGVVLRRKVGNKTFERMKNHSDGRMLKIVFDPKTDAPWLLDDPGYLQRWTGKKFEIVPVGKAREKRVLTSMVRTRSNSLILIGDGGLLLRSTDEGKKWVKPKITGAKVGEAIEELHITMYGILAVGGDGLLLVSHDDGQTWSGVDTEMAGHLWCFADVDGGILVGADEGNIYRIDNRQLARLFHAAYKKDAVLSGLASRVIDGEPGAEMVLGDALRERDLWG